MKFPKYKLAFPGKHVLVFNGHPLSQYDKYNPLNLPINTVRVRTNDGQPPVRSSSTKYETATLVQGTTDVYDVYKSGHDFTNLLNSSTNVVEVLGANTDDIVNMYYMFGKCNSLSSVAVFDTSTVIDFSYMFNECTSLTSVPLFDTTSATSTRGMFNLCTSLTSVPLFDTSNVEYFGYMLWGCSSLTYVPLFNTSKVTYMNEMLWNCFNVQSGALDLYQQASTQTIPPSSYSGAFHNCGINTTQGAAELAQIPNDWK